MFYRHVFEKISIEFCGILSVLGILRIYLNFMALRQCKINYKKPRIVVSYFFLATQTLVSGCSTCIKS